jgi:DNA segregation ATPase FtsK/SpoIIIE, S-DNA-T family
MTARTRTRPARAPQRTPKARKPRSKGTNKPFLTPEVAGALVAAAAVGVLFILIDVAGFLAGARDWTAQTFGLGILILAGLAALGGVAVSRRAYEQQEKFVRHAIGSTFLGLFAWGALGLNRAEWTLGNVDFREETLGGAIGRAMVNGPLSALAWLSLLVVGMWLLAPGVMRAFAQTLPIWVATAWERRWPHRIVGGIGAFFAFFFRKGEQEDEVVIGTGRKGSLRARLDVTAQPTYETAPVTYRPVGDAAGPRSAMGAGAAATFTQEVVGVVAPPVVEAIDEPEQLSLVDEDVEGFEEEIEEAVEVEDRLVPGAIKGGWQLPDMGMLQLPQVSASRKHDNAARAQLIVDTLSSFGVDATVVEINEGPTVTQFGVEPGWEVKYKDLLLRDEAGKTMQSADGRPRTDRVEVGRTRVRVNKITTLQNDLALALAAPSLRIEAPVPGRAIVGIEVPNDSATVVTMRNVMETKEFAALVKKSKLALALGKGVSGIPVVADLAAMPHLLIAGATGSGKSVCMNAIVSGIMMNATPDEVRFVMIDPKRVELTAYGRIPHLAFSEVIVDMDKVVGTLQAVVSEMEARYKKFAAIGVRNLESYNKHPKVMIKLPSWVVMIDELADLMMAAPFEVEKLICRLAQLARATGIHLVVATQRPSVDVITGLIKANFPTRIAFAVTSMTDSRTILDAGGAEKLLGKGDMLFMPKDVAKPIRIQGVYVSDAEVERLVEFWTDERFSALVPERADDLLHEALVAQNGGDEDMEVDEDDPMLDEARILASQHQRVSPSLLQRRLKIGHLKAVRLIEVLEEEGIVGPPEDGESRRVLVPDGIDV